MAKFQEKIADLNFPYEKGKFLYYCINNGGKIAVCRSPMVKFGRPKKAVEAEKAEKK